MSPMMEVILITIVCFICTVLLVCAAIQGLRKWRGRQDQTVVIVEERNSDPWLGFEEARADYRAHLRNLPEGCLPKTE